MVAGRPRKNNTTLRLRVPVPLITIADRLGLDYKKKLVEHFEKMMCTVILTDRGIEDCSLCEDILERRRIIDEEYLRALEDVKREQVKKNKVEHKMAVFIQQAVRDGKTRGEAETEYGQVFPDPVWNRYSGRK